MLHLIHGTDTKKSRAHLTKCLEKFNRLGAPVERIEACNCSAEALGDAIGKMALFGVEPVVVLDEPFAYEESAATVLARLDDIAASSNAFIIIESGIDKKVLAEIKKHTASVDSFSLPKTTDYGLQTTFNMFALTDALGMRDRKKLWILYQKALREGSAPEEVHSMLWWQAKTMLWVSTGSDTKGLKPFVVTKARQFSKKYTPAELSALANSLISLYHDAHRGLAEFEVGLERLILSL